MNREETRLAIQVMQAWVDGDECEWRSRTDEKWYPLGCTYEQDPGDDDFESLSIIWNWDATEYRIKPKPVAVKCYVVVSPTGGPQATFMHKSSAEKALRTYKRCFIVETKGEYLP